MQIPIIEFDFNPIWPGPPVTGTSQPPTIIQGQRCHHNALIHLMTFFSVFFSMIGLI